MAGTPDRQDGNYLVHTIKWFTIIIILSQAIDVIQQQFGVVITPPPIENDLMQLLMVSLAPIVEEIGFRVILVGIPIFLLYSHKASVRYFFRSLWNPSSVLPAANPKKAIIVIAMSAILFGMAHVMSDQGWTSGKIAQAAMSGMIIGWVYYRYGFVSAILIHWATNYVIFSYGYLVSSVNDVSIMDAFSHSLLQTIEVLFVVTGALSLAMIWLNSRKTLHVQG
ncbi:MAG: CPBP family intramembrane metalloprotease, partial [Candidatus Nitrosotenuis sp.]|nr:CPBP family intramembrane metalloprotease [Candidatus Nitrosotenuis sp.]